MLRIAVIGLGEISKVHVPIIQNNQEVELAAVCDIDLTKKQTVPDTPFYQNYQQLLSEEKVDCAHICLPHHLHYEVTKYCMEKGIHVFLEKPIGKDVHEGRDLVNLEKSYPNVKVCVSLQNRLNDSFLELMKMIRSEQYGQVVGVKGLVTWNRPENYYKQSPWRGKMTQAGGGVMMNQAIHTLDLMQLIGGEIDSMKGSISSLLDYKIDVEDTAVANMTFKSGARGFFLGTVANINNSSVELEVSLSEGKLIIKDNTLFLIEGKGKRLTIIEDEKLPGAKFYYGASHHHLIQQFYTCIKDNSDHYIHMEEAQISMEMIQAIRQSSDLNETINMEGYYV